MIDDFLGIAIVGAGLSLLIQAIKGKFGDDSLTTKGITVILAIAVGALYAFMQDTVYWETILVVLGAASTTYALFLKK